MPRDLLSRRAVAVLVLTVGVVAVIVVGVLARGEGGSPAATAVEHVVDGDTLRLVNGDRVRLVQIDAPELRERECYARESRAELERLVPAGSRVRLETDPRVSGYPGGRTPDLDKVDRFGRLLAYVFAGETNVNLELVRRGAAAPWFFGGTRGRYAAALLAAARRARDGRAGLWAACPGTPLRPLDEIATGTH